MRRLAGAALAALLLSSPLAAQAPAPAPAPTLEQVASVPAGRVGIAVIDLATGRETAVHGDERFPMASTVKLAVALTYLSMVDAGRKSLDTEIELPDRFRHSDGFTEIALHPGVKLSAANWFEFMLTQSDNSAADLLFAEVGGPVAVQRWLDAHRVTGIHVDRDIGDLLIDDMGLPRTPGASAVQSLRDADALPALTEAQQDEAAARLAADPRDQASPLGMARLLARLDRGELVSAKCRAFLLDVLSRTRTGKDRLAKRLPAGSKVQHKTGTLRGVSDDVGIVTLPGGRRFVIAVMTKGIADEKARAAIIAEAAASAAAAQVAISP
ncbi:serine hydrolase [Sphingomonas sp. ASV193]|uniref:serine hydrolase n=1 Tax=Sphingomonas sp. ASV193 TaxID=3144405 RepID=UPI0032E8F7E0